MKKSKGQTIDLLYTNKKEEAKKTKKAKTRKKTIANDVGGAISRPQKNRKTKSKVNHEDSKIINLDNEIIIGLTPKKEETKKQKNIKNTSNKKKSNAKNVGTSITRPQKSKKTNSKNNKTKTAGNVGATTSRPQNNKTNLNKKSQKKKRKNKIIKWIFIITLLVTAIILFMMSSIFNIKEIVVINNNKVSSQEIINLSTLTNGVNMFKTTNKTIRDNIRTNPYIENVDIRRNINGTVTLDIEERVATYMLQFANAYVYINNQGYMLEISEEPLELPIITGFTTSNEEIKAGNRLNNEDLKNLDDIIKIMESAKNILLKNEKQTLASIITEIDISNSINYILTMKSEGKTIQLGELKEINVKLGRASIVLDKESGKKGEIYFQDDKVIFREEVSR